MTDQPYTVRGIWPFPVDMLRHDDARAASAEDQAIIDRLSREHAIGEDDFKPIDIKLVRAAAHRWAVPNFARWRSFGWSVVDESLPIVLRETPRDKPRKAPRYTVRQDNIPSQLKVRFFVAWVHDAQHPDDPENGASISWHLSLDDAYSVCAALNAADLPEKGTR